MPEPTSRIDSAETDSWISEFDWLTDWGLNQRLWLAGRYRACTKWLWLAGWNRIFEPTTRIDSWNWFLNQRVGLTDGDWGLNQRLWLTGRYWGLYQESDWFVETDSWTMGFWLTCRNWCLNQRLRLIGWNRCLNQRLRRDWLNETDSDSFLLIEIDCDKEISWETTSSGSNCRCWLRLRQKLI